MYILKVTLCLIKMKSFSLFLLLFFYQKERRSRQGYRPAPEGAEHHDGGVRSQRVSLSWPYPRGGRRRPRGWSGDLSRAGKDIRERARSGWTRPGTPWRLDARGVKPGGGTDGMVKSSSDRNRPFSYLCASRQQEADFIHSKRR